MKRGHHYISRTVLDCWYHKFPPAFDDMHMFITKCLMVVFFFRSIWNEASGQHFPDKIPVFPLLVVPAVSKTHNYLVNRARLLK